LRTIYPCCGAETHLRVKEAFVSFVPQCVCGNTTHI
jgi:hypothetical protein